MFAMHASELHSMATRFRAEHGDIVQQAEARGIDWQKLLQLFGPLAFQILQSLLGGVAPPVSTGS